MQSIISLNVGLARQKSQLISAALPALKESELEAAREVWQKKFGAPAADANERAKHYRFLLTRGFSAEVVRRVVQQSGAPEEDFDC